MVQGVYGSGGSGERSKASDVGRWGPTTQRAMAWALAILIGFLVALPGVSRAEPPNNSQTVIDCSRFATGLYLCDAIDACNRNHKLPRWRMDIAHRIIRKYLKCDLFERMGGTPENVERCRWRVSKSAARMNKRQVKFLDRRHNAFRKGQFALFCEALDKDAEFLESQYGLGYGNDLQTCAGIGVPITEVTDYPECGDTYTTRLHGQLLGLIEPRARELLEDAPVDVDGWPGGLGWCAVFPEERSDPFICNIGMPPRPTIPPGPPVNGSREIRRCQDQFFKRFRTAHGQHFDLLEHCAEDNMECKIRFEHDDITEASFVECMQDAYNHCQRLRETTDSHTVRDAGTVKRACEDLPWSDVTDILGFSEIAADCGATNVNDLVDCVAAQVKCLAWDVARFVEARMLEDIPPEFITDYVSECEN